jgi:hypothetical protein
MPQIQGIKGDAVIVYCEPLITKEIPASGISLCSKGIHNAFPKGKQNGIVLKNLYLIYRSIMKIHLYLRNM